MFIRHDIFSIFMWRKYLLVLQQYFVFLIYFSSNNFWALSELSPKFTLRPSVDQKFLLLCTLSRNILYS